MADIKELINRFDLAIESDNEEEIYKVAVKIARIYYLYWRNFYACSFASMDEAVTEIAGKLFLARKKDKRRSVRYYFGILKTGMKYFFLQEFKHHSDELLFSHVLDREDHHYPESCLRSVDEIVRMSAKSQYRDKLYGYISDLVAQFYTAGEIAALLKIKLTTLQPYLRQIGCKPISAQEKKKAALAKEREFDMVMVLRSRMSIEEFAKKHRLSVMSAGNYIRRWDETRSWCKKFHIWSYTYNNYPLQNGFLSAKILCFGCFYVPNDGTAITENELKSVYFFKERIRQAKETISKAEKEIEHLQKIISREQNHISRLESEFALTKYRIGG